MSSAAYLKFEKPIARREWAAFCNHNGIQYSPNTVGRNTFYRFGLSGVQIKFGEAIYRTFGEETKEVAAARITRMASDFKEVEYPWGRGHSWIEPPEYATEITVSCFIGKSLGQIAETAALILDAFGGQWSADPEVRIRLAKTHEQSYRKST